MINKSEMFTRLEKILFRIYLIFVAIGFIVLAVVATFNDYLREIAELISGLMTMVLLSTVVAFFAGFIQILRYLFVMRKQDEKPRVWRSVVMFLTSPIMFLVFYIILFVLLLSMASCTYTG